MDCEGIGGILLEIVKFVRFYQELRGGLWVFFSDSGILPGLMRKFVEFYSGLLEKFVEFFWNFVGFYQEF